MVATLVASCAAKARKGHSTLAGTPIEQSISWGEVGWRVALSGVHSAPSCECSGHPPAATSTSGTKPPEILGNPYHVRMTEILGAILVGGASSRMGENKALVEIAGRPMSTWVSQAIAAALPDDARSISLGHTPLSGLPHVEDHPGVGPLSGLAAVADFCDEQGMTPDAVLLVAVDHPWTRPETLQALMARYEGRAVVPAHHRVRQVTCAVYPMSFVAAASQGAAAGKGFQTLLDDMDVDEVSDDIWTGWGEDGRSWFSVDERRDIARGLERYGPPGA